MFAVNDINYPWLVLVLASELIMTPPPQHMITVFVYCDGPYVCHIKLKLYANKLKSPEMKEG